MDKKKAAATKADSAPRRCGTPGCDLVDLHPGPCSALLPSSARRAPVPLQRFDARCHVPDFATICLINSNFEGCRSKVRTTHTQLARTCLHNPSTHARRNLVQVEPVPGKGLGVVTQVTLEENAVAAYYMGKLIPKGKGASRFAVTSKEGETMELGSSSFPAPEDGVPYIGPFANEPTGRVWRDGEPNCVLRSHHIESHAGRLRRFALITLREVKRGEELVWDYGPSYGPRDYESPHNA